MSTSYDDVFGNGDAAAAALYDGVEAVQPADVATVIGAALDMPPYVDLTTIEIMPTMQVFGGSTIAQTPIAGAARSTT